MRTFLIAAMALLTASTAQAETFAIQAGHLIVDASKPERGPSTVIVTDGKIVRIDDGATAPDGATVVDMRDKTVLPGLIDVHVHLTGNAGEPWYQGLTPKYSEPYAATVGLKNALITARAGFTTVRDLGGGPLASLAMRDAVKEGSFPGPRIMVSGPALSIIGGHGDGTVGLNPDLRAAIDATGEQFWVCTGPLECAKAVRRIAAYGVDVIKFHATGGVLDDGKIGLEQHFTDAEMKAICDTAHELGLKAAAHAHGPKGIAAAVRAGVDSIEHGTFVDDAGVALMKARGTYYSATLMAFSGLQMYLGTGRYTANTEVKARATLAVWGKGLNRAYKAGVPIALGTDAGVFPHGRNGEELGLMVSKGGMTPRDALIAATKGGADLLGISAETGTLEVGKSADLIAVTGDPLVDPAGGAAGWVCNGSGAGDPAQVTPYAAGAMLMIASGSIHAVVNAIVKGGRDKAAGRAITDATGAIILLPAIAFVPLPTGAWGWLAASAVLHAVYLYALVRAYKIGDLSAVYPVLRGTAPLITAGVSIGILGDHATGGQIAGIAVIGAAMFVMVSGKHIGRAALGWSVLTGALIASYTVIDAMGVRAAPNPASYIVWVFVQMGFVVVVLFGVVTRGGIFMSARAQWKPGVIAGLLSVLTYGSALYALSLGPTAPLAALRETGMVTALLIAIFVLKERATWGRVVGVLGILGGAALILVG